MKCKIVLWDVYGTLVRARRGDLDSLAQRHGELQAAFEKTRRNFGLAMSAESLHDSFIAGIGRELERRRAEGVAHPEVRIEEIWLAMLEDATLNWAREVALYFEREANPKCLQPHAFGVLAALQQRGVRQGIISNAQFYTPIELSGLLREASGGEVSACESVFDPHLTFYSYALGVAKPDLTAFRRAVAVLASRRIGPGECAMVGNSLTQDIAPAQEIGFKTVLYAPEGAAQSAVKPDFVIHDLAQLLELV